MAVDRYEQPFWYKNGVPCTKQHYELINTYEKSACRWTTELTIHEFSNEFAGLYGCTVGDYGANTTLHLNSKWMYI